MELAFVQSLPGRVRWELFDTEGRAVRVDGQDGRYCATDTGPGYNGIVLRMVIAHELACRGGMLLHAGGLEQDDRGWLFVGRSGVGKTTLSTGSPGTLLSDDTVVVTRSETGFCAYGTPFWSEGGRRGSTTGSRLGGVFLLEHGHELRAEKMRPREAARHLFENMFRPPETNLPVPLVRSVVDLAAQVPVWKLWFPIDYSFDWRDFSP